MRLKNGLLIVAISLCGALFVTAHNSKPIIITSDVSIVLPEGSDAVVELAVLRQIEQYKRDLSQSYEVTVSALITKTNVMLSFLGVAVTTWVGLNIHNYVERNELEQMKADMKRLEKELQKQIQEAKIVTAKFA